MSEDKIAKFSGITTAKTDLDTLIASLTEAVKDGEVLDAVIVLCQPDGNLGMMATFNDAQEIVFALEYAKIQMLAVPLDRYYSGTFVPDHQEGDPTADVVPMSPDSKTDEKE